MACDVRVFYFPSFNITTLAGADLTGISWVSNFLMESSEKSCPSQWRSLLCASSRLREGGVEYLDRRDVVNRTRPLNLTYYCIDPIAHFKWNLHNNTENGSISQLRIVRWITTSWVKRPSDGMACTDSWNGIQSNDRWTIPPTAV